MLKTQTQFRDRLDAGRQLAARLSDRRAEQPIVLALPRGGVVVGYEIARALEAPLDIIAVRKIGAPFQEEFGVGALVDGDDPEILLDEQTLRALGLTRADLHDQIERELLEIRRRERLYRGDEPRVDVRDRTVIVVDDGIATGSSVRAALRALRRAQPRRLVLATPVAPPRTLESLREDCDEVVCLICPQWFRAVGEFYESFEQTSDEEVTELLRQGRAA
ncbi:MAG TPA: phosphoribosyltransferase [Phycisphaerae bacterium]|jgi:predicted phosphoribosyltransferase